MSFWKSAFQGSFQKSATNTLLNRKASTLCLSQEVQYVSRPGNSECSSKCEVAAGDIYHKPLQLFCGNNWRVTVSPGLCLTPYRSVKFQLHCNNKARLQQLLCLNFPTAMNETQRDLKLCNCKENKQAEFLPKYLFIQRHSYQNPEAVTALCTSHFPVP